MNIGRGDETTSPIETRARLLRRGWGAVVAAALACGAPVQDRADASRALEREVRVAPAGFSEVDLSMPVGAEVRATFVCAGGAARWNVHRHDGGEVELDAGVAAEGEVRFVARERGAYSIMWQNLGEATFALRVALVLRGGAVVERWTEGALTATAPR